jgi:hypothetical protein
MENAMNTKIAWRTKAVTEVSAEDLEGVGNLRLVGSDVFRWVQNKDASNAFALGSVVFHKLSDGADMHKYVQIAATANLSVMAGVVVGTDGLAAYTTTSVCYGWIQVFGYCASVSVINLTNATPAAGDYFKGVDAQKYLTKDAATQPAYLRTIQVLESVATHTTPAAVAKKGFVNCI